MKAFYDEGQAAHDPKFYLVKGHVTKNAEQPERANRLKEGLERVGVSLLPARDFGPGPRAAVHSPDYLRFLETAHARWKALPGDPSDEVIATVRPSRYPGTYPSGVIGQAGWHMADTSCPLGPQTYKAACATANTAVSAADLVMSGAEKSTYALCRPPGHHAFADMAGGFCFLNNSAIAAQYLLKSYERVAILDVDVHHGNGTQGIFYERPDVLTISLHCDPADYYPFHWGHRNERGTGSGEGFNLNLPLPPLSGDDVFLKALDEAMDTISAFAPGALVVALGLDASEHDPLRGLSVTTKGFNAIGRTIANAGLPTVYVQEGGYLSDYLALNLASVLEGVMVVS